MSLSCYCAEWEGDGWFYILAEKVLTEGYGNVPPEMEYFFPLNTKKSRKCCSCGAKIKVNDLSLRFNRWRGPTEFEEDKFGYTEVKISPWFMCEKCGEIYLNLEALGFCINIEENMSGLLEDYREMQKD
ncbi:MAG: hypothetical protein WC055_00955 [Melioribacteraceae bacterium]